MISGDGQGGLYFEGWMGETSVDRKSREDTLEMKAITIKCEVQKDVNIL